MLQTQFGGDSIMNSNNDEGNNILILKSSVPYQNTKKKWPWQHAVAWPGSLSHSCI